MPSHKEHQAFCKAVTGVCHPEVDVWMDEPFEKLRSQHRILRHSLLEISIKYNPITDAERFRSALLHIFLDNKLTGKEAYLVFKLLGLR